MPHKSLPLKTAATSNGFLIKKQRSLKYLLVWRAGGKGKHHFVNPNKGKISLFPSHTLGILKVVSPEGAYLVLATNIPYSEADVLVLNRLNVEP